MCLPCKGMLQIGHLNPGPQGMQGHAAVQSPGALCLAASAASNAARCCSVRKGCELWRSTPLAAAECCALDTA